MEKKSLRKRLSEERRRIDKSRRVAIDAAIAKAVWELDCWKEARTVFSYLSFGSEVDTKELICAAWAEGKRVVLPRCVAGSRRMRWFAVDSLDGLVKSPLGVEEPPISAKCEVDGKADSHCIALVPGLTFDGRGFRLGYGGGYYDKFLREFGGTSVGLCRKQFLCDSLEAQGLVESHDVAVDIVVTD